MSTYLIKWNPKKAPWPTLVQDVDGVRRKGFFDNNWFFHKSSPIRRGDRAFLVCAAPALHGIMGSGIVRNEPSETHWDASQPSLYRALLAVVRFDALVHPERDGILGTRHLVDFPRRIPARNNPIPPSAAVELETAWSAFLAAHGPQSPPLADEVVTPERYFEGATRQISVNIYERNPYARQRCIEHYGCRCSVCGFDFEQAFGKLGRGFIHVHHLKPLSEIQGEYEIDPIAELRPICPNCHAMIHHGTDMMSIEQLKERIQRHDTPA